MYSVIKTAVVCGFESLPVQVETDVSDGMPSFDMVGFLTSEVKEARERVRSRPTPKVLTPEREEELRALTQKRVLPRVAPWADRLGVCPKKITVTGALKRWGSCSARGHVCFSCLLGEQEDELIDYVIVHELCHLRHMDHSTRFWQEVGRVMPDWPRRRDKLKQATRYQRVNEQTAPKGS